MAWTDPTKRVAGDQVTAAILNTDLRDNLTAMSTHQHGGAAGAGNDEMSGLDTLALDDQAGDPNDDGELQRNGSNLKFNTTAGGVKTVGR